jgi:hypothetical protein
MCRLCLLPSRLAYSSTLKMGVTCYSETLFGFQRTAPQDISFPLAYFSPFPYSYLLILPLSPICPLMIHRSDQKPINGWNLLISVPVALLPLPSVFETE